jgi:ABC-type nickel/cobalt efflux system permease component RcnA
MNRRSPLPVILAASPGLLIPGDYLARLLHQGDIGWGVLLAGVVVAFALGAIHALSPGHGKTIVAAYLVGTRGSPIHAVFLGGMVTFTHTVTVFFLGFATLFLSRYVLPERIYPVLGAVSGISIVWIGAVLLYKRAAAIPHHHHHHHHGDGHVHSHSHIPEGKVGMASLVTLGASGGLVPCPSALVLLLTAVSLGRTGLGLVLLLAFSAGLAVVLTAIGLVVLYAKHWLPDGHKTASHAVFRYLPVVSAAIIVCIGAAMTWVSLRRP